MWCPHFSQVMERIMNECMRDMGRQNETFSQYWKDADHSVVQVANNTQVVNDENKFAVKIDVSQFKPEELKVNLEGRMLTVEGKQERKDDNSYMSRSFTRSWTLPEEANVEALKTELTDKGTLIVEAPKVTKAPTTNRKNIPIHRGGR